MLSVVGGNGDFHLIILIHNTLSLFQCINPLCYFLYVVFPLQAFQKYLTVLLASPSIGVCQEPSTFSASKVQLVEKKTWHVNKTSHVMIYLQLFVLIVF